MKSIKSIFTKPSPAQLAETELEEARRKLLEAQTGFDYATAMVEYQRTRVERLEAYLRGAGA